MRHCFTCRWGLNTGGAPGCVTLPCAWKQLDKVWLPQRHPSDALDVDVSDYQQALDLEHYLTMLLSGNDLGT